MEEGIVKNISLKERLDQIDGETISEGLPSFIDATIETKRGMWRKGCAVIEAYPEARDYKGKPGGDRKSFPITGNDFSWAKLEQETERKDTTIKSWVQLAKRIGEDEDAFNIWAETERIEIENRFKRKIFSLSASSETPILPDDKYRIVYADPPWYYAGHPQHSEEGVEQETILDTHYDLMTDDELCELAIKDIVLDNAVLFLWVTSPILERSFKIIKAWGFEYKTSMVWDKILHNVGYYISVRHEFLLICTKGTCLPDNKKLFDSVYSEERKEHSKKPRYFRDFIDILYTEGKKVELFAREDLIINDYSEMEWSKINKIWTFWGTVK